MVIILTLGVRFWRWESGKKAEMAKQAMIQQQQVEEAKKQEGKERILESLIDSVQDVSLPNIDTASWSVYKNEKYGFEMKMPSDWYVENTSENWFCLKSKLREFYFEGEKDVCGISIDGDYLKTYIGNETNFLNSIDDMRTRKSITEIGGVTIDGKKGLYFEGASAPTTVLTKNNRSIWGFQIQAAESTLVKNNVQDVFYGVIQTFHFVN